MANPAGSALAPAPDYGPIFDVEPQVEAACKAILKASPYSIPNVFTQRDVMAGNTIAGVEQYPCVESQFILGAETGHKGMLSDGSGNMLSDAWSYVWNFRILTQRPEQAGNMTHAQIRASVMLHYQYFTAAYTPDNLLYHSLTQVKFNGSEVGVDTANDLDYTILRISGQVSVRPLAWPV